MQIFSILFGLEIDELRVIKMQHLKKFLPHNLSGAPKWLASLFVNCTRLIFICLMRAVLSVLCVCAAEEKST
jgi:hypothetical protein